MKRKIFISAIILLSFCVVMAFAPFGCQTTVTGKLTGSYDQPISGAVVNINDFDTFTSSATTNADGEYTIEDVPYGRCGVTVSYYGCIISTGIINSSYFMNGLFGKRIDGDVRINFNMAEQDDSIYTLKVDKFMYNLGEEIAFDYTVTNAGEEQVVFESADAHIQSYIVEKDSQEIYSFPEFVEQIQDFLGLEKGESHTYSLKWGQEVHAGYSVKEGNYTIKAYLRTTDINQRVYVPVNIGINRY